MGPRLLGQVCFWLLVSVFLRESCSVLLSLLRWAAAALLQLLRGGGGEGVQEARSEGEGASGCCSTAC